MPNGHIRTPEGADRQLLLDFASPEEQRGAPSHIEDIPDPETYEVLRTARAALKVAQNAQVRAVHAAAAKELGVAWDNRLATTGEGYVAAGPHFTDRLAVVKYVRERPGMLVGALAMIYGLERTKADKRLAARGFKVMEPTKGAAALRLEANGRVEKGMTQPMRRFMPLLGAHAIKIARMYPRTQLADGLAVGLLGVYLRAWQGTGEAPEFDSPMHKLLDQRDEAVIDVCDQVEKDPSILEHGTVPDIHDHLSVLSLRALSLRYGGLLGRPWNPRLPVEPTLPARRPHIPMQRDGRADMGRAVNGSRMLPGQSHG